MAELNLGKVAPVYKGSYIAEQTYNKYEVVFDGESSFISLINDNNATLESDGTNWLYLCKGNNVSLNSKVAKTQSVISGNGLTGGGALEGDVTINVAATDDSLNVSADGIKVNTVDTLVSESATQPLSSKQGKALKGQLDELELKIDIFKANDTFKVTVDKQSELRNSAAHSFFYDALLTGFDTTEGKYYAPTIINGVAKTISIYLSDVNGNYSGSNICPTVSSEELGGNLTKVTNALGSLSAVFIVDWTKITTNETSIRLIFSTQVYSDHIGIISNLQHYIDQQATNNLLATKSELNDLATVNYAITSTGIRSNQRLTYPGSYATDADYDILGFPVVAGQSIRLKGQTNKPCIFYFSTSFVVTVGSYISTVYNNTITGLVDIDVIMTAPSGALFILVPKAKTLDIAVYYSSETIPFIKDVETRVESLESIVGEQAVTSLDSYVITPNNIYSVCNDENINRNYSVNIYLTHLLTGALTLFKNKKLWFTNLARSIFYNSPFTIDPTYNGGVAKSETVITETIKSQCEYIDKSITFKHRSTLSSASKSVTFKHFSIGDSITNMYLGGSNKINSWSPSAYWGFVKMLFEMDKIDGGDNASEYNCIMIGSNRTTNPFNITYGSVTNRALRSFAEAKGGATIADVRTSTWGNPAISNPLYDSVSGDISIAAYITKNRTMDDNGNRLYFDNAGATTGIGGSEGYIFSGGSYILSGVNIGTLVTNTTLWDVCTPTSISIQLSQNSSLSLFQTNIAPILAIIKAELPTVKIILMVNDAVMTYFPEDFPEYKEASIIQTASVNSHISQLSIFNYLKTSIEDEANGIYVLSNLFTAPDAKSLSSIDLNTPDGLWINNQEYGLGTYAHPNNRAHAAWGYQLYGLLKYINS